MQQLPALFIVDHNRKIEYAHYAVNSGDIPELDEMLRLVEKGNCKKANIILKRREL